MPFNQDWQGKPMPSFSELFLSELIKQLASIIAAQIVDDVLSPRRAPRRRSRYFRD
jgi:hypothetical protein